MVQPAPRRHNGPDFARRLAALSGLPLRAATVRDLLGRPASPEGDPPLAPARSLAEVDPGWQVFDVVAPLGSIPALDRAASRAWWAAKGERGRAALDHLWRHSVAFSRAARRLALEAGRDDAERLASVAMLQGLGLWAVAAVDPEALAGLLEIQEPEPRREAERRLVGEAAATLGRSLAERWRADPLLIEAAWLVERPTEVSAPLATDPRALGLLQEAFAWAERTPWALYRTPEPTRAVEPSLRVLIAEVQVRCGAGLIAADATTREEVLSRSHARMLAENAALRSRCESQARFLDAFAALPPTSGLATLASAAGHAWCNESGVTSAAVLLEPNDSTLADPRTSRVPLLDDQGTIRAQLVFQRSLEEPGPDLANHPTLPAWKAWFRLLDHLERSRTRLDTAVFSHQRTVISENDNRARDRLASLAEFAAGAAHELNNPLAVVVGRAQLLLARGPDEETARYLRAILGQAQRAHRILRDLMGVARPTEPRWRPCQPAEIVRGLLRDHRAELEARSLKLESSLELPDGAVWTDPDGLRQILEILLRNAIEATPAGGPISMAVESRGQRLQITVQDAGPGMDAEALQHLLDPFYCGRQAGRGLGLGLPRAWRYLELAGGSLRWQASPGQPTSMRVHLPIGTAPPKSKVESPE